MSEVPIAGVAGGRARTSARTTGRWLGAGIALAALGGIAFAVRGCTAGAGGGGGAYDPGATSPLVGDGPFVYDLGKPVVVYDLPPVLREVSAITSLDATTVACLQDEKGTIFRFDVRTGRLAGVDPFGPDGDYEGLARVGEEFFVLRSDGLLMRVTPGRLGSAVAESIAVDLPSENVEGLCFDPTTGMLLLAPKDQLKRAREEGKGGRKRKGEGRDPRDERLVFAWDPKTKELADEPVVRISVKALLAHAEEHGDRLPTRTTRTGRDRSALKLMFSCVAVHPRSNDVYLLSAVDRILLVVDRAGKPKDLHVLSESVLPKPEGITFMPNGDLVLSTEGVDGPARIAIYRPGAAPQRDR